jgi:crotonobetaine/carnitine-CoA ligase
MSVPSSSGGPGQTVVTVSDLVRLRARTDPDHEILRLQSGRVTYRSLDERSAAIAAGLSALGVAPGERVAVLLDTSAHAVEAWIALARLRCIEVPLSTALRGESLAFPLRQARCAVLITTGRLFDELRLALPSTTRLRHVVLVDDGAEERVADPRVVSYDALLRLSTIDVDDVEDEDPCHRPGLILFSSGTTGAPKGVVLSHAAGFALAEGVVEAMSYDETDVLYNVFPLSHVNARFTTVLAAMLVNATAVLHQRFSASRFWAICREEGVTAFNYMGTLSALLLAQPASPDDRDHRVRSAYGSGTVGDLRRSFSSRFGVAMVETYGSTELGMVTHTGLASSSPEGSCGRAVSDYLVAIHDPAGHPAAPGEIGEIVVRPTEPGQMFLEYFDNPEATVTAWRDLWFHTGDRGHLDGEGWLYFADRLKDMIRRRGENISSWQVEQAFLAHPAVAEACAVGVPSHVSGEEVLVALVLQDQIPPAELVRFAERQLPRYAVPRYVRVVASLPKTASSRVEKYKMRAEGVTVDTWDAQAERGELAR